MDQNVISNRVDIDISDADLQTILANLKSLQSVLVPYLVDLGPNDRISLAKQGPKSVDFVSKTLGYSLAYPTMIGGHVDLAAFQADAAAAATLRSLQQLLDPIAHLLESSQMQTSSQAYVAALQCYKSFQVAADAKVANAVTITHDLAERFLTRRSKTIAPVTPSTPAIKGSIAPRIEFDELEMAA